MSKVRLKILTSTAASISPFGNAGCGSVLDNASNFPTCKFAQLECRYVKVTIMKIDRRRFLVASSSALVLAKTGVSAPEYVHASETSEPLEIESSIEGKQVTVYTTAANSNHRLSVTDTLTFKHLGQPLETQICVFVDPARRFQTILGIGGALTDASAETFAKLPKAKQRDGSAARGRWRSVHRARRRWSAITLPARLPPETGRLPIFSRTFS